MRRTTMKKTQSKEVVFQYTAAPGSQVSVVGTFNNWDTKSHPMKDNPHGGVYATSVMLPSGRHEYKFIVNGKWCMDPKCTMSVPNPYGSLNNVLSV